MTHAWLFVGPKGIGKATCAFRLARHLLDPERGEATAFTASHAPMRAPASDGAHAVKDEATDPGLACRAGRLVAAGSHPDLLVVERPQHKLESDDLPQWLRRRQGDLSVDRARAASQFLRHTAADGGWRVVIIDDAEMLNRNAANALLKILEEPPGRTVLILVCSNIGTLPITIRSRCRRLAFASLSDSQVAEILRPALPDATDEALQDLTRLAQGSAGRAVRLALADVTRLNKAIDGMLEGYPKLDGVTAHRLAESLAAPNADLRYQAFVTLVVDRLAALCRGKLTAEPIPQTMATGWRQLANMCELDRLVELWEKSRALFNQADAASLDRQQAVLQSIYQLLPQEHG